LYHPEVPDLDMIVRTSGEERISGFMLWRAAYSEFMFIKKYFPDMTAEDITMILDEYEKRNRRFGK
jgi:undecaprenyl diphosphate synthase